MARSQKHSRGFTLFEIVFTLICLSLPISHYFASQHHRDQTKSVLEGPANGAADAYSSRTNPNSSPKKLSTEARDSRAPGHYQKVVRMWRQMSEASRAEYGSHSKASWVVALETKESLAVSGLLAKMAVTRDALVNLDTKLEDVSPQLTKSEAAMLQLLTDSFAISDLEELQRSTVRELEVTLLSLGASKGGLEMNKILLRYHK